MEVFFGKKASPVEKLVEIAGEFDSLHKVLADTSVEVSMLRRTLVSKTGAIESCATCTHFHLPEECDLSKIPSAPTGWCPGYKRKPS